MDRAIGALRGCVARLSRRPMRNVRAIATEACRQASNGAEFLRRAEAETGLKIDTISSREEAELAVESCAPLLAGMGRRALLFDIGGGSTELAWVRLPPGGEAPELIGYISLPMGVVTMAERYGADAFHPATYEVMVAEVIARLVAFETVHCIGHEIRNGGVAMLGTSGTVTTLAGIALDLPRYSRPLVDGVVLSADAAREALARLQLMGREGLSNHPCVGPERAEFVLPGCAVFSAIHRLWPAARVVVADRGLREGMLLRMMRADRSRARGRREARSFSTPMPGMKVPRALACRCRLPWRWRRPRCPRWPLPQAPLECPPAFRFRSRALTTSPGNGRPPGGGGTTRGGGAPRGLAVTLKTSRGRTTAQQKWLTRQLNDPYVAAAKAQGFRSRAAFKLIGLNEKFKLLRPGMRVLDLGAAPGGWSQVAIQSGAARVLGLDLLPIEPLAGASFLQGDFNDADMPARLLELLGGKVDLVLSDIAPNTTGHGATDHIRIVALADMAFDFAKQVLTPGGAFVAKVFQGGSEKNLLAPMKLAFAQVRHAKPPASRKDSSELYVVATGFRAG